VPVTGCQPPSACDHEHLVAFLRPHDLRGDGTRKPLAIPPASANRSTIKSAASSPTGRLLTTAIIGSPDQRATTMPLPPTRLAILSALSVSPIKSSTLAPCAGYSANPASTSKGSGASARFSRTRSAIW
jgi:hypothetical protein